MLIMACPPARPNAACQIICVGMTPAMPTAMLVAAFRLIVGAALSAAPFFVNAARAHIADSGQTIARHWRPGNHRLWPDERQRRRWPDPGYQSAVSRRSDQQTGCRDADPLARSDPAQRAGRRAGYADAHTCEGRDPQLRFRAETRHQLDAQPYSGAGNAASCRTADLAQGGRHGHQAKILRERHEAQRNVAVAADAGAFSYRMSL